MPVYEYSCEKCSKSHDIVKPMADCAKDEFCPDCKDQMIRVYSKNIEFHKTKVKDAEYYHSFGCVVKNDYHRSELMKKHNVIEVGNERPDRARHYMERDRKERMRKRWETD